MLFKKLFLIVFLFPTFSYSNTDLIKENKEDPIIVNIPSISLGEQSNASGNGSIAIGTNSQAKNTHSVAIGTNSLATEENTVSFGNIENKHTSRLVNVSEGKNNTDAVNFAQAKKLVDKSKIVTNNTINQLKRSLSTDINNIKTNMNDFDNYYKKRQSEITDSIANLDKEIIALEKKVFAGIASSVAMTSIPYLSHHTLSGGIGISNYRTGTAFAGGVQYKPNNDIAFRLNSSINSEKEIIIGGGLAYGW
ncbi:YadA-like family protein [Proteus columbae]|uniref:YadA-like family protein n=1 Tax=Proteus columbae TaxID=1987580 RepID=UPI0018C4DB5C|nr:YadA-like family protein [Proteus columbae]MBG6027808.1 hemagglutinin [Proteus mirabilis]MBG6048196.1 hemagglutinin [Proteus mirabilis]